MTYFKYLDALHRLAQSRGVQFRDLDRILYIFDKEQNGSLSLECPAREEFWRARASQLSLI